MTNQVKRHLPISYLSIGIILLSIGGIPLIYGNSPELDSFFIGQLNAKPYPTLLPDYILMPCVIISGIGIFFILREDYGI